MAVTLLTLAFTALIMHAAAVSVTCSEGPYDTTDELIAMLTILIILLVLAWFLTSYCYWSAKQESKKPDLGNSRMNQGCDHIPIPETAHLKEVLNWPLRLIALIGFAIGQKGNLSRAPFKRRSQLDSYNSYLSGINACITVLTFLHTNSEFYTLCIHARTSQALRQSHNARSGRISARDGPTTWTDRLMQGLILDISQKQGDSVVQFSI
ncbi:hypothetical protein BKA66DRAFT_443204 [Pyrenochaeta sp. MPI-SDFR-AT-0127]|nr:hypothetical protein BKA66DRAFT_443204 [Pyrenochaeta sp. MPI-SDFR-AT-0127]